MFLLRVGTANDITKSFLRDIRGLLSCMYWIFEVLIERKFSAKYDSGICNWYLSLRILVIAKHLDKSGKKRQ